MAKQESLLPQALFVCATCGSEKNWNQMGDYGDGRAYCLARDGRGALCWRERPREARVAPSEVRRVTPAGSGAWTEAGE